MNITELRGKADEDLKELLDDIKDQVFRERFAAVTETVANPASIRRQRRDIARIKTVLRERELEAERRAKKGGKKR